MLAAGVVQSIALPCAHNVSYPSGLSSICSENLCGNRSWRHAFILHHPRPCTRSARVGRGTVAVVWPVEIEPTAAATVVTGTSLLAFGLLRTFVYIRIQYIIAGMLGRHVPRGGSRVLDLGIREGRNLYYYPKDVLQVVALTPSPDVQLLESQAAKAMVPIDIIRKPPDASGLPSNSMDAVVSVYGMAELSDTQIASVLRETVRVLKPGKPFIFIENVGSKGMPLRTSQKVMESVARVFGNRSVATRDLLPYIQETDGLEDMQYEMVLDFQDPHIVGLATKNPVNSAPVRISKDKGFKKNKQ